MTENYLLLQLLIHFIKLCLSLYFHYYYDCYYSFVFIINFTNAIIITTTITTNFNNFLKIIINNYFIFLSFINFMNIKIMIKVKEVY